MVHGSFIFPLMKEFKPRLPITKSMRPSLFTSSAFILYHQPLKASMLISVSFFEGKIICTSVLCFYKLPVLITINFQWHPFSVIDNSFFPSPSTSAQSAWLTIPGLSKCICRLIGNIGKNSVVVL